MTMPVFTLAHARNIYPLRVRSSPALQRERVSPATVRTPSLRIRLSRWVSTVRWLMPSSSAISLLVRPWATPTRTWRSRAVSWARQPSRALARLAPDHGAEPAGDRRAEERLAPQHRPDGAAAARWRRYP